MERERTISSTAVVIDLMRRTISALQRGADDERRECLRELSREAALLADSDVIHGLVATGERAAGGRLGRAGVAGG